MRPWPILLRLLLSLTLVLNGTMSAMAATSMQMNRVAEHMPAKAMASQDTSSEPSCHEHGQTSAVASGSEVSSMASATGAFEKTNHPAIPDCCKFGTCDCACTHLAQAAFPSLGVETVVFDGHRSVHWLTSAHTAPELPHLIRPPIG